MLSRKTVQREMRVGTIQFRADVYLHQATVWSLFHADVILNGPVDGNGGVVGLFLLSSQSFFLKFCFYDLLS